MYGKIFFSKNQPLAHASSCPLHAYLDERAFALSHTHTRAHALSLTHTHYILARAWYLSHTCFVNNHLAFLSDTHALSLSSTHISSVVSCMLVHVQWYSVVFGTAA